MSRETPTSKQAGDPLAASEALVRPAEEQDGTSMKCKLIVNCFRLTMSPTGAIHHYHFDCVPASKSPEDAKWLLQQLWDQLTKHLEVFVVRHMRQIFSPSLLNGDLELRIPGRPGSEPCVVTVKHFQTILPDQFNSGRAAEASVVANHVLRKMASSKAFQKVGRRYYSNSDANEGKAQLKVFSGFCTAIQQSQSGPLVVIDHLNRVVHKRNVIETIQSGLESSLEGEPMDWKDPAVRAEWRRRVNFSTVVTVYNNRVYHIKAVRFDLTVGNTFKMYQREEKTEKEVSFQQFYEAYYNSQITEMQQPLLEAYPEKDHESVFLVPELCSLTGFTEDLRKDKTMMVEAMQVTKVSPQDRHKEILEIAGNLSTGAENTIPKVVQDWSLQFDKQPVEVEAVTFKPLEVCFGPKKYFIEDGNFQKWMRNGLQCPTRIEDWIFIYPESDSSVLDVWFRSLKDIAQVAFTMKMADPTRIVCTNQKDELESVLVERVTPRTQMVLLLTPQKDSRRVYQLFKQIMCTRYPCVTQVVKSETVRKRHAIAAVLSRIVLQINAKFCGPLWHIDLETALTAPLFQRITMVIGIDIHFTPEREQFFGFVASLNSHCTEYFSMASGLEKSNEQQSLSVKLQETMRDALLQFARRNDGLLPEHFIVYRGSAQQEDHEAIRVCEVEALRRVIRAARGSEDREDAYEPDITFLVIARRHAMRFFAANPDSQTVKNPEPGTAVTNTGVNGLATTAIKEEKENFFLFNQASAKGTSIPTHYTVLYDSMGVETQALQSLTYRLSFLYFNFTGSVKLPAPAHCAKKIAHLIGTAVKQDPHRRLRNTFFYL
mmetsp:Transcript_40341/g.88190  ORF Transcript_40341/g.88190 Transcript_40341/m.88190 type:complete len:827 (+) Transcript_40341:24-2504(+)